MSDFVIHTMSALLIVLTFCASSVIYSPAGKNVSITCRGGSIETRDFMRWLRFNLDGSLEIIEKVHRFSTEVLNGGVATLTVFQVELADSGRYYCGESTGSYIAFSGHGNVLQVEEPVWTNNIDVILLTKLLNSEEETSEVDLDDQASGSYPWDAGRRGWSAEFRCVVTGLSAPAATVKWRSSRGLIEVGRIWEVLSTNGQYTMMSAFTVRDRAWDVEYEYDDYEESWWCEVQAGENFTLKSDEFVLSRMKGYSPEWCVPLLYSVVTLGVLCVLLLIIFTGHWVCYLSKGTAAPPGHASPVASDPQGHVSTSMTYVHLSFNQAARPGGRQQASPVRPANRQTDTQVYSELKHR